MSAPRAKIEHATRRSRAREGAIFHGWWIVLVAFVCFAVNTGLIFYAWGIFLVPLAEAFGGRARVSGAYSAMQLASAAYGLYVGRLVDRHGARPIQVVGVFALAAGFLGMSQVVALPGLYLCLAGPIAVGSTCIAALPNNAAVARWFVRRRGQAFGLSTAGISAGGILFAPLAQWLNDHYGWRHSYAILAGVILVLLLPPIVAFMRRDPSDLGLLPDGDVPATADAGRLARLDHELETSVKPSTAVRLPSFWYLAAAFGLTMGGLSAVLLYQVPLLIDRGMDPQHASFVLGATAAMGVVGKLGFGALLDRYDQRRVAAVCFCLQALGVLILWLAHGAVWLTIYVVLYGYAMGGNATLLASLIGETFGRVYYGTISGRLTPFVVGSNAIAVPLTGLVRDRTGGFGPALVGVILAALVAAVLILRVTLPRRRPLQDRRASRTTLASCEGS